MKFYFVLAVLISGYVLSAMLNYKTAEIHRLGHITYWKYNKTDVVFYSIYKSPIGVSCFLNDDVEIDCNEL